VRIRARRRHATVAVTARRILIALAALLAAAVIAGAWLAGADQAAPASGQRDAPRPTAELVARGRYLATVGNCGGCHTARGEAPYAGGRALDTPFGTVYASNITPDRDTGLGGWSADDFWRALHEGRSRDGRLLYPAFPYPNYTRVTRDDADAIFAYLASLPAVRRPNRQHALRFPYDRQAALWVWRALFFRPGVWTDDSARPADWNRGAYLVRGLGHCDACHGERNLLGATGAAGTLAGGAIPVQGWYAPSLAPGPDGRRHWGEDDLVALLRDGTWSRGTVMGPMAEVVLRSTQHLEAPDLRAIASYLASLPPTDKAVPTSAAFDADGPAAPARGATLYREHCADCHGTDGNGRPGAYPPLAGNPSVTLASPANAIRAVLGGGFAPGTAANPRPHGMPPFGPFLGDDQVAAVVTHIRRAWGNEASPAGPRDVARHRGLRTD